MAAIHLWWSHNWGWVVALVALVTSRWWIVPMWRAYLTISDHLHTREIQQQHVAMLASVTAKLELGFETEYNNQIHGLQLKIRNPYTKANQVSVQEVATQQIEGPRFPQPRDFAQVLEVFRPNPQSIFLFDTVNGPFTGPMDGIGHVALASPTGGGKTTTARMVISQVLACGGEMYMVNPNYAPVKLNGNRLEDWRPIAARLKAPPAREFDEIEALFDRFLDLVDERRLREQTSPKRGKDLYLFIGEWPAILAQALAISKKKGEEITAKLGRLLRETRQYGVHVISEFQDALVATIGGNSGVRENYRTAYYFGGDDRTAKVVLSLSDGVKPDNTGLGKMGGAMFRFQSNAAIDGRVPFFSNRALYMLLGWPQDPVRDDPVTDMDQVPDVFLPFVNGRVVESDSPNFFENLNFEHGSRNTGELVSDVSPLYEPREDTVSTHQIREEIEVTHQERQVILGAAYAQLEQSGQKKVNRSKLVESLNKMDRSWNNKAWKKIKQVLDEEEL
jgi:hypothetical protein